MAEEVIDLELDKLPPWTPPQSEISDPALQSRLEPFADDPVAAGMAKLRYLRESQQARDEARRVREQEVVSQYDDPIAQGMALLRHRRRSDIKATIDERQRVLDEPERQRRIAAYAENQNTTGNAFIDEPLAALGWAGGTFWSLYNRAAEVVAPSGLPVGRQASDEINRTVSELEEGQALNRQDDLSPWLSRMYGNVVRSGIEMYATPGGTGAKIAGGGLSTANRAVTEGYDGGLRGSDLARYVAEQTAAEVLVGSFLNKMGLGGAESIASGKLTAQSLRQLQRQFVKHVRAEGFEEGTTQGLQDLSNKLSINPDLTLAESLKNIAEAALAGVALTGAATIPDAVRVAKTPKSVRDAADRLDDELAQQRALKVEDISLDTPAPVPADKPDLKSIDVREWIAANPEKAQRLVEARDAGKLNRAAWTDAGIGWDQVTATAKDRDRFAKNVAKTLREPPPVPPAEEAVSEPPVVPTPPVVVPPPDEALAPTDVRQMAIDEELAAQEAQGRVRPAPGPPDVPVGRTPATAVDDTDVVAPAAQPTRGIDTAEVEQEAPVTEAVSSQLPPAVGAVQNEPSPAPTAFSQGVPNAQQVPSGSPRSQVRQEVGSPAVGGEGVQPSGSETAAAGVRGEVLPQAQTVVRPTVAKRSRWPALDDSGNPLVNDAGVPIVHQVTNVKDGKVFFGGQSQPLDEFLATHADPKSSPMKGKPSEQPSATPPAGNQPEISEATGRVERAVSAAPTAKPAAAESKADTQATAVPDGTSEAVEPQRRVDKPEKKPGKPKSKKTASILKKMQEVARQEADEGTPQFQSPAAAASDGSMIELITDAVDSVVEEGTHRFSEFVNTVLDALGSQTIAKHAKSLADAWAAKGRQDSRLDAPTSLDAIVKAWEETQERRDYSPENLAWSMNIPVERAQVIDAVLRKMKFPVERIVLGRNGPLSGAELLQPAFHGSPHRFDKFSTDKIGTGEGAQSYGWGLYFAGNKEVAQFYKDKLKGVNALSDEQLRKYFAPGSTVPSYGGGQDTVVAFHESTKDKGWYVTVRGEDGRLRNHFTTPSVEDYEKVTGDTLGTGYHVDLKPAADEYLDWGKPLSEQSDKVQDAVMRLLPQWNTQPRSISDIRDRLRKARMEFTPEFRPETWAYPEIDAALDMTDEQLEAFWKTPQASVVRSMVSDTSQKTGKDAYEAIAYYERREGFPSNPEAASRMLRSVGIRGNKYLDQGSRGRTDWVAKHPQGGEQTFPDESAAKAFVAKNPEYTLIEPNSSYNYVIFDDADVEITGLFQGGKNPKGAAQLLEGGKVLIRGFEESDESTAMHEIWHAIEMLLLDPNVPAEGITAEDIATYRNWTGLDTATDSASKRKAHEKGARGWERYLREGAAPKDASPELKSLFAKIKEWLLDIYETLRGLPELNPKIRTFFDRMVTRGERLEANARKPAPAPPETESWEQLRDAIESGRIEDALAIVDSLKVADALAAAKEAGINVSGLRTKEKLSEYVRAASEGLTGVSNAMVEAVRALRNEPPPAGTAKETWGQWLSSAAHRMSENPRYIDGLVTTLNENPTGINQVEQAALNLRFRELENEQKKLLDQLASARQSGEQAEIVTAETALEASGHEIMALLDANKRAGEVWGRTGSSRQILLRSDFSFQSLQRRLRAFNAGKPLDAKVLETLGDLAEHHADAKDKLTESRQSDEAAFRDMLSEKTVGAMVQEHKSRSQRPVKVARREAVNRFKKAAKIITVELPGVGEDFEAAKDWVKVARREKSDRAFDDFMHEVEKEIGKKNAAKHRGQFEAAWEAVDGGVDGVVDDILESLDPDDKKSVARTAKDIARALIEDGVRGFQDVLDGVEFYLSDAMPDITRRDVQDAISDYGDSRPFSKSEVEAEMADIRSILQKMSALEDIYTAGEALQTGPQRRELTDEARQLVRDINDAKRKYGVEKPHSESRIRTIEDTKRRTLRNAIHDLEVSIKTATPIEKPNGEIEWPADIQELIKERDVLAEEYRELFPRERQPQTPEQRLKQLERAAEASLKRYEQLVSGEFEANKSKRNQHGTDPSSIKLRELQERRDAKKAEWEYLQSLSRQKTPEQIDAEKLAAAEKSAQEQADRAEEKLRTLEFDAKEHGSPLNSPTIQEARNRKEAAKKEIQRLKKIRKAWEQGAQELDPLEIELKRHVQRDKAAFTRLAARRAELFRRMQNQEFDVAPKPPDTYQPSDKTASMRRDLERVEQQFYDMAAEHYRANRTTWESFRDKIDYATDELPRTVALGADISPLFLQLGLYTLGHPVEGAKLAGHGIRALLPAKLRNILGDKYGVFGDEHAAKIVELIENREGFKSGRYARHGIRPHGVLVGDTLRPPPQKLKAGEKPRAPSPALPGFKQFQRAVSAMLALGQANVSDALTYAMSAPDGTVTESQDKLIGNAVRASSGIGDPDAARKLGGILTKLFLAPNWVWSRFKIAFFQPLWHKPLDVGAELRGRSVIARELYIKPLLGFAGAGLAMWIAHALNDDPDDDKPFMPTDPRDQNLLHFRFGGRYYDFTAGMAKVWSFAARMLTGQQVDVYGKVKKRDRRDTAVDFAEGKLGPTGRLLVTGAEAIGTGFTSYRDTGRFEPRLISGKPVMAPSEILGIPGGNIIEESYFPASAKALLEEFKSHGVPKSLATSLLVFAGINSRSITPYVEPWGKQPADFPVYRLIRNWNANNPKTYTPDMPSSSVHLVGDEANKYTKLTNDEFSAYKAMVQQFAQDNLAALNLTDSDVNKPTELMINRIKHSLSDAQRRAEVKLTPGWRAARANQANVEDEPEVLRRLIDKASIRHATDSATAKEQKDAARNVDPIGEDEPSILNAREQLKARNLSHDELLKALIDSYTEEHGHPRAKDVDKRKAALRERAKNLGIPADKASATFNRYYAKPEHKFNLNQLQAWKKQALIKQAERKGTTPRIPQ